MTIKETKTKFIAICSVDGEGGTLYKVGDSMGTISKCSGSFVGATAVRKELTEAFTKHHDSLVASKDLLLDKVVAELRNDLNSGDLTALYELLSFIPEENLKAYLPE